MTRMIEHGDKLIALSEAPPLVPTEVLQAKTVMLPTPTGGWAPMLYPEAVAYVNEVQHILASVLRCRPTVL